MFGLNTNTVAIIIGMIFSWGMFVTLSQKFDVSDNQQSFACGGFIGTTFLVIFVFCDYAFAYISNEFDKQDQQFVQARRARAGKYR